MAFKLFFSLMFVIIGVILWLLVSYYLETFPGGFSTEQSHWGSFGSYFGGIVTPIISLFSLLAVVFTVSLQKQILDSQRNDFSALSKLQVESNQQLKEQVAIQLKQSKKDSFESKKSEMLKIIQSRIEQFVLTEKTYIRSSEGEIAIIEMEGALKNTSDNEIKMSILGIKTRLHTDLTDIHISINAHHTVSMLLLAFKEKNEQTLEEFFFNKMEEITPN